MQLGLMWRELARPFQVTVVAGIMAWTFLATYSLPLLSVIWTIRPNFQFETDPSNFFLELMLFLFFAGVATVPLVGTIGLLTVRMSEGNRGILALFITVFSFIPLMLLGFDALGWILQNWQLATIATVWVALVWMMARTFLRGKAHDLR